MEITKTVIQNQLKYISVDDCNELVDLLSQNVNVQEYIVNQYTSLMEHWHKQYPMLDIPSGVITIGINGESISFNIGNKQYDAYTVFDIASITKLYTEFVLFAFLKEYQLSLDTKIKDLTTEYVSIQDKTIFDLLEFKSTYRTKIDIRNCTNSEDAIKALRTVYILPEKEGFYLYTDLPIMILTDIMEMYTQKSYKELFSKYIIEKYDLRDTYLEFDDDRYVTINKGLVNDPKANIMGGYYGHAGIKTTGKDFNAFLYHVMKSEYVELFVTASRVIDDVTDKPIVMKGMIGNSNISNIELEGMASKYLPPLGFAIQGSVRCHGEACKFIVEDKEYVVTSSIFLDLYTQVENIKEYEKYSGKCITKEYVVDKYGLLIMCDVRSLLPYGSVYKALTDMVGKARVLLL